MIAERVTAEFCKRQRWDGVVRLQVQQYTLCTSQYLPPHSTLQYSFNICGCTKGGLMQQQQKFQSQRQQQHTTIGLLLGHFVAKFIAKAIA